jgi:DNA repair exonuclease SbcCD ATPase subunit
MSFEARSRSSGEAVEAGVPLSAARPKKRPTLRLIFSGKARKPAALKDVILSPFMEHMINLRRTIVVSTLAAAFLLLTGCSSFFGDPREEANETISEANSSIAEHNRLFEEARDTYSSVKENIESGDEPSRQREDIVRARESMQEARGYLQEARTSLSGVEDLEVEEAVVRYSNLLSGAMESQLEAEATEIEFYELLEEDPALENRREDALELLEQVGEGYAAAEEDYEAAQELANSNPDVLSPQDQTAPEAPEEN